MMIGSPAGLDMAKMKHSSPSTRKADRIAAALERQIVEGRREPGHRLDERGLAEEFGVSRTPIREAIRQLASMGLIEDRGRRGIIVANLPLNRFWTPSLWWPNLKVSRPV